MDREALGKLVRSAWRAWAKEQPNPKPSWLLAWDELTEPEREVDRRIGETLWSEAFRAFNYDRSDPFKREALTMPERKMHSVSLEVRPCIKEERDVAFPHAPHVYHIDTGYTDRYHWCPGYTPSIGQQPEFPEDKKD